MPGEPKKINVQKTDTAKDIIAQLIEDDTAEVILVVPKFSLLVETENSFRLIQKAALATGKKITVESVDDAAIQLAKAANLAAFNPFFTNTDNRPRTWKDIEKELSLDELEEKQAATEEEFAFAAEIPRPGRGRRWRWTILAGLVVLAFPLYYLAFNVLPRAEIKVITKKVDWSFNDLVSVEKNGAVPTEVFSEKKNAQMAFPATGKKVVSQKASGKVLIYNAHNSSPQQLVATTRFVDSEGHIFRLTKNITIPGAKIEDNQIKPSSLEAEVVADKPGADYNIASGVKLTIPGFKGTAKYKGFYGESLVIAGGKIGEVAFPTEEDIKKGKTKIAIVLEEALRLQLASAVPTGVKLAEGGRQFTLLKATVNPETNEAGEFTIIAEGEIRALGFREQDLLVYLENKMREKLGRDYSFKEKHLTYDIAKVDFERDALSLPVDFQSRAWIAVDARQLRQKLVGKSEEELRQALFSLPGLANAEVSLWPIYVRKAPTDEKKLKVVVD